MSYRNRRYRIKPNGTYAKRWDATEEPGWFKTKEEALLDAFYKAHPEEKPDVKPDNSVIDPGTLEETREEA